MNDPFLTRRSNAAELFLIRHGDALPGEDEIIPSGIYDDLPLSRTGREQVTALTERLKEIHFDAIYCSPLRRCQETAAPLTKHVGLAPTIVEGIKEIHIGEVNAMPVPKEGENLEALSKALHARQVEIVRIAASMGNWDTIEGSEPSRTFRKRVVDAMDEIVRQCIGKRVLVFAHGGVINAYTAEVLGLERDFFFPCANTSITMVRASTERRVLFTMNDVAHLRLQS